MNKVIINGSFIKRPITGVARYAHEISNRILRHENISIACDRKTLPGFETNKILHVPQSWATKVLGSKVWNQFDLPRYIGSNLLWSPENIGPLGIVNHVVTIHDLSVLDHPEWFRFNMTATYNFYLPRLIKQAKAILTDSEYFRVRILERFCLPEERISVVPCGVDIRFQPCSDTRISNMRKHYKLPEHYILSLSSLEPRKNLHNLFRAWGCLTSQEKNDVTLVVAGDRGKVFVNPDYQSLIEKSPDVIFTGYFPELDLPALYSGALGLIYPSFYEGFGLPPLEAMACGTPVITCNNTSIPEVVGKNALFVDPLDLDSIATAIKLLIEDTHLRSKLSQAGLERAKLFSWDKSAELVWNKLDELRDQTREKN